jgi:hypothetical protein
MTAVVMLSVRFALAQKREVTLHRVLLPHSSVGAEKYWRGDF